MSERVRAGELLIGARVKWTDHEGHERTGTIQTPPDVPPHYVGYSYFVDDDGGAWFWLYARETVEPIETAAP